jgi:N-acetyl-anhydromuramyl-L-alanine amidase AmpD
MGVAIRGDMLRLVLISSCVLGCAVDPGRPAPGPLAESVRAAAERNGVPAELMLAIGAVEGGLLLPRVRIMRLDDEVPVAGVLELRHGRFDSLARGAALVDRSEMALRTDTDLGTEAGARVLAELGQRTGASRHDLASWQAAIEELSGMPGEQQRLAYAAEVIGVLQHGGVFPAREGESVYIAEHPELEAPSPEVFRQAANGTPDFPGATWFTTSCTSKCTIGRPDGNASVDTILIHDTEGGWNASVATLQNDSGKSVHYIIDADGVRVGQFRPETDTTWHAGNFFYNKHSVGIEHVGFVADKNGYKTALYQKSVELVKSIRSRWNVPLDRQHIVGHYQVPDGPVIGETSPPCSDHLTVCEGSPSYGGASNHTDPGIYWQWCQYMDMLGGSCACNDAYEKWNCTSDKTMAVRCVNGVVELDRCDQGCTVMATGVADVCSKSDPTVVPGRTGIPTDEEPGMTGGGDGAHTGGCSTSGTTTPSLLALLMCLLALAVPRLARKRT